jgi:diaminobutyrate-2-oxoglutarate transaminase
VFTHSTGSLIFDKNDNEYIDFFSGAGGLNYGHNSPTIKQSMVDYINKDGIIHGLDMATEAKIDFISTFQKHILKPRNLDYKIQFTSPAGASAVEAALKLARLVKKKPNIIAFTHSFHGVSLGALAVTSNSWFRSAAGTELSNVTYIPYDGYIDNFDSLDLFEKMLDDPSGGIDQSAAVIVETIQGEGGVNIASIGWLRKLRKITLDRKILLIIDDIQAGCGRSGDFFSFEQSGINPDLVVLSKSISASGLPMSLLLIKPEYDIWKPGQHSGTFRGNNLAFVSAAKAITEFWTNDKLSLEVRRKEKIIDEQLNKIAKMYPEKIAAVRGRGMFYGLAFKEYEDAKKVANISFSNHLIIETCGSQDEVLKLMPALTIDDDLLINGLDILANSIAGL